MKNLNGPRAAVVIAIALLIGFKATRWIQEGTADATAAAGDPNAPQASQSPTNPATASSTKPTGSGSGAPPRAQSKQGSLLDVGVDLMNRGIGAGARIADRTVGLTPDEARKVGVAANALILKKHRVADRPNDMRRIKAAADPFLPSSANGPDGIRFFIIDDPNLNAFAHVGGYVYVHTGLLKRIQDEEELRFVIGHEIAHVRLRHCAEGVLPMVRAQQAVGQFGSQIAAIAHKAIAVSYSEDREFEADEWSYRQMREQGFPHDRALLGLRLLQRNDRSPTTSVGRAKGLGDHILEHFRTHPTVRERLQRLEAIRAAID